MLELACLSPCLECFAVHCLKRRFGIASLCICYSSLSMSLMRGGFVKLRIRYFW